MLLSYLPLTIFFIMVACPGHFLKSTKGIEINLVHIQMLMKGSTEDNTYMLSVFSHMH